MPTPPAALPDRLRAFGLIGVELALILLVVRRFDIAEREHFFLLLCLAAGGFVVHAWLPRPVRPSFFVGLSLGGVLAMLGWPNGAWVLGLGGGLIALGRLPVPLLMRVVLLAAAGVALAALRVDHPDDFWPVLGSMFMFRLIVYVFETRHDKARPPLAQTLAYFFPLPNVCFPLFPILDFKTFRDTYYDGDEYAGYQTGVAWMVRGLSHLLAYRFVKHYLLPAPYELRDAAHLALFLAANYALYLRVSGWFHLITGLLRLFGFNLPRTHDNYFLASSLSDIWRRINIYWKDFMAKVFFFPAFFALRRWGTRPALVGASLGVFAATWLLHSYQMFWLTGDLPGDASLLWLAAGVLVAGNILLEARRANKAAPPKPTEGPSRAGSGTVWVPCPRLCVGMRPSHAHAKPWAWHPSKTGLYHYSRAWAAVTHAWRVVGVFTLVSFFWACWTMPGFVSFVRSQARGSPWSAGGVAAGAAVVLGVLGAAAAVGVLVQWGRDGWERLGITPRPLSFRRSVALHAAVLGLVLLAATEPVAGLFGPRAAELAATLRRASPAPLEAGQIVRGYYEEIAEVHAQAGALLGRRRRSDEARPGDVVHYTAATRPADALLGRELIPGWRGELAGRPLHINHFGMRDRDDLSLRKPAGACRIALVGSSVVLGYGVGDDEVFARLLETQLNATPPAGGRHFEVLNFGLGLSDVISRRVRAERDVFRFGPDALFYFAHQDELFSPARHLAAIVARGTEIPYPDLREVVRQAGVTADTPAGSLEGLFLPFGRDIVQSCYRDLAADCRRHGVAPVWVYLPMPGVTEVQIRAEEVAILAREAGFAVVNLADWADGYAAVEVKRSVGDHHPNARGHRLIAERLFAELRRRPDLLPRSADRPR